MNSVPVEIPTHTDEARELVANGAVAPGSKALDVPVESMTDREILAEILIHSRNTRDAVTGLMEAIDASPLGKLIKAGGNPLAGMSAGG